MPAGTIHAPGPGLLLYEVQQASDLTYRIFDWNRPATPGRVLHIEKSLAVANPSAVAHVRHAPDPAGGGRAILAACRYFTLEIISGASEPVGLSTDGQTFHALTLIEGAAEVVTTEVAVSLNRFASVVIPAACGRYQLTPHGNCKVLKASIE
jgi:mannose-6-phosphate isomerase